MVSGPALFGFLLLGCPASTPSSTPTPTNDTAVLPLEEPWVFVAGGTFEMGSDLPDSNEQPVHSVTVPDFAIMRHEVTIAQYQACEDAGACLPRGDGGNCLDASFPDKPANCMDYDRAWEVCTYLGGRLLSESEWEYAATEGGTSAEYPWGDAPPDCTRANMNQPDEGWSSCDNAGLWDVCTHPAGDTPSGLCDMGGNIFEWVADWHNEYAIHPTDGSPQTEMLYDFRSMRGGSIGSDVVPRSRKRTFHPPDFSFSGMGTRCGMSL